MGIPVVWQHDEFGDAMTVSANDETVVIQSSEDDNPKGCTFLTLEEFDEMVAAVAKARKVYAKARKAVTA